jgi:hypothetical protein
MDVRNGHFLANSTLFVRMRALSVWKPQTLDADLTGKGDHAPRGISGKTVCNFSKRGPNALFAFCRRRKAFQDSRQFPNTLPDLSRSDLCESQLKAFHWQLPLGITAERSDLDP